MSNLTKLTDFFYQIELYLSILLYLFLFELLLLYIVHTLLFITRIIKKLKYEYIIKFNNVHTFFSF